MGLTDDIIWTNWQVYKSGESYVVQKALIWSRSSVWETSQRSSSKNARRFHVLTVGTLSSEYVAFFTIQTKYDGTNPPYPSPRESEPLLAIFPPHFRPLWQGAKRVCIMSNDVLPVAVLISPRKLFFLRGKPRKFFFLHFSPLGTPLWVGLIGTRKVLDHSLICSLARSHRSLTRSLAHGKGGFCLWN